jgi:hypothetical protein
MPSDGRIAEMPPPFIRAGYRVPRSSGPVIEAPILALAIAIIGVGAIGRGAA